MIWILRSLSRRTFTKLALRSSAQFSIGLEMIFQSRLRTCATAIFAWSIQRGTRSISMVSKTGRIGLTYMQRASFIIGFAEWRLIDLKGSDGPGPRFTRQHPV